MISTPIYHNENHEGSPMVIIPQWVLALAGAVFLLLLGIIGYLVKFLMSTFKEVVNKLEESLAKFVESFQDFKDGAPKEYVTHPFLKLVRDELKDDVANSHRRIKEASERFEKELHDHRKECPVRVRTILDDDSPHGRT